MSLIPGDPLAVKYGMRNLSPEIMAAARKELGLDEPVFIQYLRWLVGLARLDFGSSIRTGHPVVESLLQRLPVTLELMLLGSSLALASGLALGIYAASRPTSFPAAVLGLLFRAAAGVPPFYLATVLVLAVSVALRWLPPLGYVNFFADPAENLRLMILPSLTLAVGQAGLVGTVMEATLSEALQQDYVLTAHAKGLTRRVVTLRHALRNALLPVITIVGLQVTYALGGAIAIENVFDLPGLGSLLVNAIFARDYPVVQGATLAFAIGVVVTNTAVDIAFSYVDPRTRR